MDLFQIQKVKELREIIANLNDKLEQEQANLRNALRKNTFLEDELQKTSSHYQEIQEYMQVHVDGKPLSRYTRPEVLVVVDKYESLSRVLNDKVKELDLDKKKFEVEKELYKRNYEIQILSEYTHKKDSLISMLATKQPIQNMMLEKRDTDRWDR